MIEDNFICNFCALMAAIIIVLFLTKLRNRTWRTLKNQKLFRRHVSNRENEFLEISENCNNKKI